MGEQDAAQAAQLVRALHDVLCEMRRRLTWIEARDDTPQTRPEAVSLRQDIAEAQQHISRLESRYLRRIARVPS